MQRKFSMIFVLFARHFEVPILNMTRRIPKIVSRFISDRTQCNLLGNLSGMIFNCKSPHSHFGCKNAFWHFAGQKKIRSVIQGRCLKTPEMDTKLQKGRSRYIVERNTRRKQSQRVTTSNVRTSDVSALPLMQMVERWCESLSLFQLSSKLLWTNFSYHTYFQCQP